MLSRRTEVQKKRAVERGLRITLGTLTIEGRWDPPDVMIFGNMDAYRFRHNPVGSRLMKSATLEIFEFLTADKQPDGKIARFHCPGCRIDHAFLIERPAGRQPCWTWDGNVTHPTFEPSLLVRSTRPVVDDETGEATGRDEQYTMCHLFVRDGKIVFLPDCAHELAGTKVPLPPLA